MNLKTQNLTIQATKHPKHLYYKKLNYQNKLKLNYFSPKIWRIMYLIQSHSVHHTSEKRIRTRSSVVPITFLSFEVIVHAGKRWYTRKVNKWMVGFRFGEFTWNRKFAVFKAKQKRKKNKKK